MNNEQNIEVEYIKIDKDINYSQLKRRSHAHDVQRILDEYGFSYEKEKTFNDLKMKRMLRFDYYIDSLNCLIEFDGEQHYYEIDYFRNSKDAYLKQYSSDKMKSDYALENNINLIRIPYWSDVSQIRVKIDRLIGNKQLYLNKEDQEYLQAFIQTLDLNYVEMNKVYDDYDDMLKKLKVNFKLSYPTFKKYLIVNYDLDYKEIINKNSDWYEIYSNLDDNEYDEYKYYKQVNVKINEINEVKNLNYYIKAQLKYLDENNELDVRYITSNIMYSHFKYWLNLYNIDFNDFTVRRYGKALKPLIESDYDFKMMSQPTTINRLLNKGLNIFNFSSEYIDKSKNTRYYKNLNYNK